MVIAKLNYLRIAPRKVRLVADLIRGKRIDEARSLLSFATKKATLPVLKLLEQAAANAKNNFQLDPSNLFISKITVDEGPKFKRWRARARGQAYEIQKKTSHITIILEELVKSGKKTEKKAKEEALKIAVETKEFKEEKKEKPKFRFKTEERKPQAAQDKKRVFRRKAI